MNWNRALAVFVAASVGISAGCAGCNDDGPSGATNNDGTNNGDNNGDNNGTNNGTANNQATNNGTANNGVLTCLETQMIDLSNVTEDTVVEAGNGVCYSSGDINVMAKLTLEPGVQIAFTENAAITVAGNGGKLEAVGTANAPIILTGVEKVRGFWRGIVFDNSESLSNVLDHVVVEYAGGSTALAAVHVKGDAASVAVTNTMIRESKKLGFLLDGLSELRAFSNNTITSNETGAAAFAVASAPQIGEGNALSGNDVDVVLLQGSKLVNAGDIIWNTIDVPYRISETLEVRDTDLVLKAGNVFEFEEGAGLEVRAGGSFAVEGAEGSPVTLTGVEKQRGGWRGVKIQDTDLSANSFDWAIIEYGGGGDSSGGLTIRGYVSFPAAASLTNTILRENEGFGLALESTRVQLPAFEGNTITANEAPVSTPADHIGQLAASDYSGNDEDAVFVAGKTIETPQTIPNIGIPYRFDADVTLRDGGGFTIEPGAVLEFDSDTALAVRLDGFLNAVGDATNPIVFRGAMQTAGYWKGVEIKQSNSANNVLQHVEISDGGSSSAVANLSLNTCCGFALRVELADVKLSNGAKAGLNVAVTANTPSDFFGCSNITFENVTPEVIGTYATLADFQAVCQ